MSEVSIFLCIPLLFPSRFFVAWVELSKGFLVDGFISKVWANLKVVLPVNNVLSVHKSCQDYKIHKILDQVLYFPNLHAPISNQTPTVVAWVKRLSTKPRGQENDSGFSFTVCFELLSLCIPEPNWLTFPRCQRLCTFSDNIHLWLLFGFAAHCKRDSNMHSIVPPLFWIFIFRDRNLWRRQCALVLGSLV